MTRKYSEMSASDKERLLDWLTKSWNLGRRGPAIRRRLLLAGEAATGGMEAVLKEIAEARAQAIEDVLKRRGF